MEEIIAKLNDNEEEDAGLVPEKGEDPAPSTAKDSVPMEDPAPSTSKDSVPMEEDVHNSELDLEENDVSVGDDSYRDPDYDGDTDSEPDSCDSVASGVAKKKPRSRQPPSNNRQSHSDTATGEEEEEESLRLGHLPDIPYTPIGGFQSQSQELHVTVTPTVEMGDTDCDSDDPEQPTNDPRHLPRRLLGGQGEVNIVSYTAGAGAGTRRTRRQVCIDAGGDKSDNDEIEEEEEDEEFEWTKDDPGLVGSKIPVFTDTDPDPEIEEKLASCQTAYDYYKLFSTDAWVDLIVYQSKLYAVQKGAEAKVNVLTHDTFRTFEGFLLHTGYHTVPQRRMVWETMQDCYNPLIAESIRRDTVDTWIQFLHFRDNSRVDDDSYYKVCPIFNILNQGRSVFLGRETGRYSVDEVMIPYFGKHSSKQFIRGKPVRYGYKIWSLCSSDGCGLSFEPYCGRHTRIDDAGMGQGPNVVLEMVKKTNLEPGAEVYMDNLFTSFPLLNRLSKMKIAGTGTVRMNRLYRVPIMKKKEFEKKEIERGALDVVYKGDICLSGWKDNKPVYVASNKFSASTETSTCQRYSREERRYKMLKQPVMIEHYNAGMGGVDLLDNMVSCYRVSYRNKKWWFPFFRWSINVMSVNARRMRQKVTGKKEHYLNFLRELVVVMMKEHGTPPQKAGRKISGLPGDAANAVRYCTVLYLTILYYTVHYYTLHYYIVHYYIVYYTVHNYTVHYYTVQ